MAFLSDRKPTRVRSFETPPDSSVGDALYHSMMRRGLSDRIIYRDYDEPPYMFCGESSSSIVDYDDDRWSKALPCDGDGPLSENRTIRLVKPSSEFAVRVPLPFENPFPKEIELELEKLWPPVDESESEDKENLLSSDVKSATEEKVKEVDDLEFDLLRISLGDNTNSVGSSSLESAEGTIELPRRVGPIEFDEELQSGAWGTTFSSKDLSKGRVICTKMMGKRQFDTRRRFELLLAELETNKRVAKKKNYCPFLMQSHGLFQDESFVYLVMDLMEGDLLSVLQYGQQKKRLWLAQLALGIKALHAIGILHCDIKPENVLVDTSLNLRIADFGAAYLHDGPLHKGEIYCKGFAPTEEYSAYEMHREEMVGPAVDWWSLGCILFSILAEEPLFDDPDDLPTYIGWNSDLYRMSYVRYRAKRVEAELSNEEETLICGLLDKDPITRFSFEEVVNSTTYLKTEGIDALFKEDFNARASKAARCRSNGPQADDSVEKNSESVSTGASDSEYWFYVDSPLGTQDDKFKAIGWINPNGIYGV